VAGTPDPEAAAAAGRGLEIERSSDLHSSMTALLWKAAGDQIFSLLIRIIDHHPRCEYKLAPCWPQVVEQL
jgi:hypothetical protein